MISNHTPEISVVLPCGSAHAGVLADCLRSLREQRDAPSFEIIVINSHDDETVAATALRFGARLAGAAGSSLTAGGARNMGIRESRAPVIAFIDADCIAESGWLRAVCDALAGDMSVVGGPVSNLLPVHPVATMDNLMQFVDQSPGRPPGPDRAFPGCNMAMRKSIARQLGGFDEVIEACEDTMLVNEAARRWPDRVWFVPSMRVRHRGRTSLGAFVDHQFKFGLYRGQCGVHLTRRQQRLGKNRLMAALAAGRRFVYFAICSAQWNAWSLPRLLFYSPVLLVGLVAWASGFNKGCRTAVKCPSDEVFLADPSATSSPEDVSATF